MSKTQLLDVVNFNADASCLSSAAWLQALRGGVDSVMYQLLNLYVVQQKTIALGLCGATAADIYVHNVEAIELIRKHPGIFKILPRPFAHDNGLLRTPQGFDFNLATGLHTLKHLFGGYENLFLPPEFMLTLEQADRLLDFQMAGVFLHPIRYSAEIRRRIYSSPYYVRALADRELLVLPVLLESTGAYLAGLHHYQAQEWNNLFGGVKGDLLVSWRDGESVLLVPDGIRREASWLAAEDVHLERITPSQLLNQITPSHASALPDPYLQYYPVHSFSAWMKEMRMLGYLQRINYWEERLPELLPAQRAVWLQTINSDILSAVEKPSPVVKLADGPQVATEHFFTIWRSERNFEGEEWLWFLEHWSDAGVHARLEASDRPHLLKLKGRINYLLAHGEV